MINSNNRNRKEELLDAISPKNSGPMLVSTRGQSRQQNYKLAALFFLILAIISAGAFGYYFYRSGKYAQENENLLAQKAKQDSAEVLKNLTLEERLARHIVLPEGQQAKVEIIQNAESLKTQDSFFTKAQDGDIKVLYPNLELIYNPASDRLVAVRASLPDGEKTAGEKVAGAQVSKPAEDLTLDILNGAGVAGLAAKTAQDLQSQPNFHIAKVGNAAVRYPQTIIVNLKNKDVSGLEEIFNVKAISSMPKSENPVSSDVAIILGK